MSKKKTPKKKTTTSARRKITPRKTAAASPPDDSLKKRAAGFYRQLTKLYPHAKCSLKHDNAFELLVATILSAQCTDKRVNMVTVSLFEKYAGPDAFAVAKLPDLEKAIRTTGFYRNKAKNIQGTARMIVQVFEGQVPDTMEQLLTLPGVARKTANVVLGNAFGKNIGVVVDTHVGRLSKRMGLTCEKAPVKVERDLMLLFAEKNWTLLSHLLINHGRAVCAARNPDCENCTLKNQCPKIL